SSPNCQRSVVFAVVNLSHRRAKKMPNSRLGVNRLGPFFEFFFNADPQPLPAGGAAASQWLANPAITVDSTAPQNAAQRTDAHPLWTLLHLSRPADQVPDHDRHGDRTDAPQRRAGQ